MVQAKFSGLLQVKLVLTDLNLIDQFDLIFYADLNFAECLRPWACSILPITGKMTGSQTLASCYLCTRKKTYSQKTGKLPDPRWPHEVWIIETEELSQYTLIRLPRCDVERGENSKNMVKTSRVTGIHLISEAEK